MAVALQADDAWKEMVILQNEVQQIITPSTMLLHERQQRLENFVDGFSAAIGPVVQAFRSLREAYVSVVPELSQAPTQGVHPQVTPNPSGPPSVASSGGRTAQSLTPPPGTSLAQLLQSAMSDPNVVSNLAEVLEASLQQQQQQNLQQNQQP